MYLMYLLALHRLDAMTKGYVYNSLGSLVLIKHGPSPI
jgi:hypothetical protein